MAKKPKKQLTRQEEFEILKLVLDKFLWIGFAIMLYGLWVMVSKDVEAISKGFSFMIAGAIILVLFIILLLKEYEISK